jgi:hypothetical protein
MLSPHDLEFLSASGATPPFSVSYSETGLGVPQSFRAVAPANITPLGIRLYPEEGATATDFYIENRYRGSSEYTTKGFEAAASTI